MFTDTFRGRKFTSSRQVFYPPHKLHEPDEKKRSRRKLWDFIVTYYRKDKTIICLLKEIHKLVPKETDREKEVEFVKCILEFNRFLCGGDHFYLFARRWNRPITVKQDLDKSKTTMMTLLSNGYACAAEEFWLKRGHFI